ncbi:hypothetical protein CR203_22810 [Salipaludibacillus neizhouensis]|uniref:Uncharacterized protein n=1 Tax=Salipaludibacillus neizhouensis TaxID=885475 RepID=A0A3A9K411_9BACI|nr:hypothetical protein [Salipaludibacillus neizhouensis]RKL65031.1 hypothetical protein CR203_22810 [Salipaludibacillus neizhouensis]
MDLNYQWELVQVTKSDMAIQAVSKNDTWKLKDVLADTYQMSRYFRHYAPTMIKIKKEIFEGRITVLVR